MTEKIYYTSAKDNLISFLNSESTNFPQRLQNQFLNYFNELGKYEEEGVKIRPHIIFTNSIDTIVRAIPNTYKISMFIDPLDTDFNMRMKSLISFCKAEWSVYVCIKDEEISYGLVKTLNSIKEKSFSKLVYESESLKAKQEKLYIISVETINTYLINLKGLKGKELSINFSLNTDKAIKFNEQIKEFVNASFSKLRTTQKKLTQIKTMYENVFEQVFKNVNGALCVVVDKDYVDNGFFSDGIWLKEPISFSKLFLQSKSYSEPKLLAYCNLFISMLKYDGITIVDNTGTIRAYNVFVEINATRLHNITGGARKRAAYTVIHSRRKRIIGTYFQSHDGEVFYKPNIKEKNAKEKETKELKDNKDVK
jgi:hypothetical protein